MAFSTHCFFGLDFLCAKLIKSTLSYLSLFAAHFFLLCPPFAVAHRPQPIRACQVVRYTPGGLVCPNNINPLLPRAEGRFFGRAADYLRGGNPRPGQPVPPHRRECYACPVCARCFLAEVAAGIGRQIGWAPRGPRRTAAGMQPAPKPKPKPKAKAPAPAVPAVSALALALAGAQAPVAPQVALPGQLPDAAAFPGPLARHQPPGQPPAKPAAKPPAPRPPSPSPPSSPESQGSDDEWNQAPPDQENFCIY